MKTRNLRCPRCDLQEMEEYAEECIDCGNSLYISEEEILWEDMDEEIE